jgi:hypothetical protein
MIVELPGGFYDDVGDDVGNRLGELEVSPLSGADEELLAQHGGATAELVTDVLSRCVRRVGATEPIGAETVRALTVGDRQFLMLKLREVTFGPHVALVTRCSWPGCGQKVDIDFEVPDVPIREAHGGPVLRVRLTARADPDTPWVSFRLPTGADQERCAPLLDANPAEALRELLELCVLAIGTSDRLSPEQIAELSPLACAEIEAAMAEAAPGPAMVMCASCPGCGREFDVPLDVADLFFGETRATADLLYRQVHYLAYHYHWGESEILSLPRAKRLHYVELLAEEIESQNHALG